MRKIIKTYLLVVGNFNGSEERLKIRVCEKDAIGLAEDLTDIAYEYCYIYELNDEYPNGRKEINYICHIH